MKPIVIVNSQSRRGRTGRRWPRIATELRAALGDFEAAFSAAPGDGLRLGREAMAAGYRHVVAVGGDGTIHEVLNGMAGTAEGLPPDAVLSPLPCGTGNELCRSLGFLRDPRAPYDALRRKQPRRFDLLAVTCTGLDGEPVRRLAFTSASFGAAAEISYRSGQTRLLKKLGGRFSYFAVTLLVALTYGRHPVQVRLDGGAAKDQLVYTALCCNTEHVGGGMWMAPGASQTDGLFDLVTFACARRRDVLLQRPDWLYRGRHLQHPEINLIRGQSLRVDGDPAILVDGDGETIGRLPLAVSMLPGALTLYA